MKHRTFVIAVDLDTHRECTKFTCLVEEEAVRHAQGIALFGLLLPSGAGHRVFPPHRINLVTVEEAPCESAPSQES